MGESQYELGSMTSPPSRVNNAFKTFGLIDFLIVFTDPSANATRITDRDGWPSAGSGPPGWYEMSLGAAHGTQLGPLCSL